MKHSLVYENNLTTVSGVVSVEKFDPSTIVIRLEEGVLEIIGSGFVLKDMAQGSGKVSFDGSIRSLAYKEKANPTTFLKRLFQ